MYMYYIYPLAIDLYIFRYYYIKWQLVTLLSVQSTEEALGSGYTIINSSKTDWRAHSCILALLKLNHPGCGYSLALL